MANKLTAKKQSNIKDTTQKGNTQSKRTSDKKSVPSTSRSQHLKSRPTSAVSRSQIARQVHSVNERKPGSSQAKNGPLSKGDNNTRD